MIERSSRRAHTRCAALRAAAAAFAAFAALPAAVRAQEEVRVGFSPGDAFAEGVYAQQGGFFKAAGLSVKLMSLANSGAIGAAVAGGAIDIAPGNAIAIANAREQGLPFYVVTPGALFQASAPTTLLMVAKNSPVTSAKALEGKTIATVELRGIMQASIRAWMVQNGADPKTLHFIELPFAAMAAALTQGRVDAAMIAEPALMGSRAVARVLGSPYAAIANEWYINMWFASKGWLTKNPAMARAFVAAIGKTAAWADTHHAETATMLHAISRLPDAVLARMPRARFAERFDPALVQPVLDTALKFGILKRAMAARELVLPGG